ncbi:DsbA family protein [Marihabitans asiaticum]|uniref:2-hydroxychromene-2-carboxylate isomerase n=1 Tax=Marihabitans asiaticum TaxID=415218 RepID=A0A560W7X5_9MICO|nr:DsbA family protein [Marihabitans asiaticum]TWD13736.1 2-hydroxychromene-2-carboxylate isomerase [Marihabitans asiaticum]
MSTPDIADVDFYFDPACPWAWMASRWMMEVEQVRDVRVRWRQMSLWALNEDKDLDEGYRAFQDKIHPMSRVVAKAIAEHGDEIAKPLYDALGERIHHEGRTDLEAVVSEAVAQAGLPESVLDGADDASWDAVLRAKQQGVVELVGDDVGTPTITIGGTTFFGPVVSPAPQGEAAGRLWDGCVLVAGTDGFFELKRSRDRDPIFRA